MTSILDGHGGIKTITYTDPVAPSLTGTLTITLADNTTTSLSVQNGKGITSIAKTGTIGDLTDVYTISYNDGTTSTFNVTNGAKGDTGDSWYVWIRYSGSEPTQDSDMGTDPDNWIGIYSGTSSTAPTHYTDYDWFEIKGEKGDQGDPSSIVSQSVTYQEGTTPNIQPSGTWTTTIPAVAQGNYLWTKTEIEFNSGSPVQFFSVARMGVDGAGSVSSVNGQSPDGTGNVTVTASNIQTTDSTSVQYELDETKNTLNSLGSDDIANDSTDVSGATVTAAVDNLNTSFQSDIAIILQDPAQKTIDPQQYVVYNNLLYKAKKSIPSGTAATTYTDGTYLEQCGDGGLNDLELKLNNAFMYPSATAIDTGIIADGTSTIKRVRIYNNNISLPNGTWTKIGEIPSTAWALNIYSMFRINSDSNKAFFNGVYFNTRWDINTGYIYVMQEYSSSAIACNVNVFVDYF